MLYEKIIKKKKISSALGPKISCYEIRNRYQKTFPFLPLRFSLLMELYAFFPQKYNSAIWNQRSKRSYNTMNFVKNNMLV